MSTVPEPPSVRSRVKSAVIASVARGETPNQTRIAADLGISRRTVRYHWSVLRLGGFDLLPRPGTRPQNLSPTDRLVVARLARKFPEATERQIAAKFESRCGVRISQMSVHRILNGRREAGRAG